MPSIDNGTVVLAVDDTVRPLASVRIESTTTLRAIAFKEHYVSSNVDTHTYIFLNDVIRQSAAREDLPERWDGRSQSPIPADYEMDPEVVDDTTYSADLLKGLRELPTMSIVLDPEDMFGEERGIYINSAQRGRDWEHATSIEIIEPDGTTFQTDSGIRIHGFSWRNHGNTPKHSFRLEFRDEYGPAKMNYPLFPMLLSIASIASCCELRAVELGPAFRILGRRNISETRLHVIFREKWDGSMVTRPTCTSISTVSIGDSTTPSNDRRSDGRRVLWRKPR